MGGQSGERGQIFSKTGPGGARPAVRGSRKETRPRAARPVSRLGSPGTLGLMWGRPPGAGAPAEGSVAVARAGTGWLRGLPWPA